MMKENEERQAFFRQFFRVFESDFSDERNTFVRSPRLQGLVSADFARVGRLLADLMSSKEKKTMNLSVILD